MVKSMNHDNYLSESVSFQPDAITAHDLAPRSDWSTIEGGDHLVQFYEDEAFLLGSLSSFMEEGLNAGDACVVVATKRTRDGLETLLRTRKLDFDGAVERDQYFTLDAADTLSKFMVNGTPESSRFVEVIGGLLARAALGGRRVRVFGEMVALLCGDGNHAGAVSLEGLWNDLQRVRPFTLFCAYPMNIFGESEHAGSLADVCASHSRVIPAESYTALGDADERLRVITHLQQKASALEAEIVERKDAEERLRVALGERERLLTLEQSARAEAEGANRLKDEFLATVSHELRTPLTAILGWVHMLRNGSLDEVTARRALETVERNAAAQAQLIEDILDVSRVVTGKLCLDINAVDVVAVINAAIDSIQLAADSKDIRLDVTLDASARRVSGDASRLQQVIWNLLSNAIKFTPCGGRIGIRLERAGAEARLSVSDTGQGIAREFLPFVFDRFRQADGTSTRRHGGLGLGLAIVRHLVELHGGTVSADSAGEGCGATFTILLPLAKA